MTAEPALPKADGIVAASGLVVDFATAHGPVRALDGLDLTVREGEVLGVVGESGSGKSTFALAIGRILAPAARVSGSLTVDGVDVLTLDPEQLRQVRRRTLGYIFQNPIGALDPTRRVRRQLADVAGRLSRAETAALLGRVGLDADRRLLASFPHELSGGMAQRVAIAMAIARGPRILVADEPTSSLDASLRGQILELLVAISRADGVTLLLFSHDLRSIARYCQRVVVMYAGRAVEAGERSRVFHRPTHPYTSALLASAPGIEPLGGVLQPIPGLPPVLHGSSKGCAFAPRCAWAIERCSIERPEVRIVDGRVVLCHRAEEVLAAAAVEPAGTGVGRVTAAPVGTAVPVARS